MLSLPESNFELNVISPNVRVIFPRTIVSSPVSIKIIIHCYHGDDCSLVGAATKITRDRLSSFASYLASYSDTYTYTITVCLFKKMSYGYREFDEFASSSPTITSKNNDIIIMINVKSKTLIECSQ